MRFARAATDHFDVGHRDGEVTEKTLAHEGEAVREFYAALPKPVLVDWKRPDRCLVLRLLEELGIEYRVGHPAAIRKAETRKQKHDRRDAALIRRCWKALRRSGCAPQQPPDQCRVAPVVFLLARFALRIAAGCPRDTRSPTPPAAAETKTSIGRFQSTSTGLAVRRKTPAPLRLHAPAFSRSLPPSRCPTSKWSVAARANRIL